MENVEYAFLPVFSALPEQNNRNKILVVDLFLLKFLKRLILIGSSKIKITGTL